MHRLQTALLRVASIFEWHQLLTIYESFLYSQYIPINYIEMIQR